MITARTRIAGVIGDPVRHSLSPAIHNAAFEALGLDWVYVAFDVPGGSAKDAIKGMRALGIEGLNVTMPHKSDVAKAVDRLSPVAKALGAVNTVVRQGDLLVGASTDGEGFVNALRADEGIDPAGKRFLVLGAGGAARAVVRAVGDAGAAEVVVVARRTERGGACAKLAGSRGRVGSADEAGAVDVVVNATPVGMHNVVALPRVDAVSVPEVDAAGLVSVPQVDAVSAPQVDAVSAPQVDAVSAPQVDAVSVPLDPDRLAPGQLVVDLVYEPLVTPLVAAARARGVAAVNGIGMLIHQAALAFRLWTGEDPPLEAMSVAALSGLASRASPPRQTQV